MKKLLLLIVLVLALACFTPSQGVTADSGTDAFQFEGLWRVGGVISNRWVYDIHDVDGLEDLYDSVYL